MNFIKKGSALVFLLFAGVVSVALGCGGGGGATNGNSPSGGTEFTPISQVITTIWRIQVVNGNTGQAIPGATFTWATASEPTASYHDPAFFMGAIGNTYQTNANGEVVLNGQTTLANVGWNFDAVMNYNWTCSAPSLKTSTGYQEFPTASWVPGGSSLSTTQPSYYYLNGTLVQKILLYP